MDYKLQSDQVDVLAQALVAAQKVMDNATKDAKNPFFKNNYATLESVIEATKKVLADNGLVVTQGMLPGDIVVTTLLHTSGQWIRSYLQMTPSKNDPQGIGSAITYARRYSLAAMCNITQVDDDAQAASDDLAQISVDNFVKKVNSDINPDWTKDYIVETLKGGSFGGWREANKRAMFEYLKRIRSEGYK
jgi:hypothetical protein